MEEFHLRWRGFSMAITVEGKIIEEETEVEVTATESIEVTSTLSKIIFEHVDRYYKPSMPYVVQVRWELWFLCKARFKPYQPSRCL
ncbi:ovostatin-like, partial [Pseudonaja textilis]|uniref:ovostatin-like n=1 Tax=Pseudonaja textilis TaxID=8673 RepID=UPI000EAA753D